MLLTLSLVFLLEQQVRKKAKTLQVSPTYDGVQRKERKVKKVEHKKMEEHIVEKRS